MPGGPSWWQGRFRGYGYRLTMPRKIILDVLSGQARHLSADEVYMAVRRIYPAIGLTTVYRTLDLLARMGLVTKLEFGDGRSRYELTAGPRNRHHHHLICIKCGRVKDYSDFIDDEVEFLSMIGKALFKKYNFEIKAHQLQFYGLCDRCQGTVTSSIRANP